MGPGTNEISSYFVGCPNRFQCFLRELPDECLCIRLCAAEPLSKVMQDPLVEAVFDDLDPKDKDEFEGLKDAKKKRHHKRAMHLSREEMSQLPSLPAA